MRILLVEDDRTLADGLQRALRQDGYAVDWSADGQDADGLLTVQDFDLVILDLSLPGLDGLGVLRALRARNTATPVLILTARGELDDRIRGLDLGADDYMTKPFDLPELEARVRALLRRSAGLASPEIVLGPLSFDSVGRTATVDGKGLELPRRELSVLEILMARAGKVVSKEQIASHIFDYDDEAGLDAIQLYVHRLRRKLESAGVEIRTVRGLGYLMEKP